MKPTENKTLKKLSQVIDESLALLKQASIAEEKPITLDIPVLSLLDQCIKLCEQHHIQIQETIHTVHHFGLPLNSEFLSSLATLANTCVLKDIHPNNNSFKDSINSQTLVARNSHVSDQVEHSIEDDEYRIQVFLNDLQQRQWQINQRGQRLLICDNHYFSQNQTKNNLDLLALLNRQFNLQSLIIVTDPIDSYYTYCYLFKTNTPLLSFANYCQGILDFIEKYPLLKVIRYEDFIAEPEKIMKVICDVLTLPFNENFLALRDVYHLNNNKNQEQPTETFIQGLTSSSSYSSVCTLFHYENRIKTIP